MATTKTNTKKATKAVETKQAEVKSVEKKEVVKFDAKAYSETVAEAFKDNTVVDVKADYALDYPRSTTEPEWSYIHFFKKGTEKDLFKMYNTSRGTRFAISAKAYGEISEDEKYTTVPVTRNKNGEKHMVYADVKCSHEDAIYVANAIIKAYVALTETKAE